MIEGEGKLINSSNGYAKYSQDELLKDGSIDIILKPQQVK